MHTNQIGENLFLVDLQTGRLKILTSSYILQGKQTTNVETGPISSIPNLISEIEEVKVKLEDVAYGAVSHIHLDHGGGVGTLLMSLANANVIVHRRGAPHLIDPERLWRQSQLTLGGVAKTFGAPEPVPNDRILAAVWHGNRR